MDRSQSQPSLQISTAYLSSNRTAASYNKEPIARLIGMGELVRNQNPPLQKTKAKNARWFIRPYVDRLQPDGSAKRDRERIYLGSCSDVDRKNAGVQRAEVLRRINNGSFVLQSQAISVSSLIYSRRSFRRRRQLGHFDASEILRSPEEPHSASIRTSGNRPDHNVANRRLAGGEERRWTVLVNPNRSPQPDELRFPPSEEVGPLETGQPGSTRDRRTQTDGT